MAGSTATVLPPPYISAAYLNRNAAQLSKMNGHWELFLDKDLVPWTKYGLAQGLKKNIYLFKLVEKKIF